MVADAVEIRIAPDTRGRQRGQRGPDTLEGIERALELTAQGVYAGDVVPRIRVVRAIRDTRVERLDRAGEEALRLFLVVQPMIRGAELGIQLDDAALLSAWSLPVVKARPRWYS